MAFSAPGEDPALAQETRDYDESQPIAEVVTSQGSELTFINHNPFGDPAIGVVEISSGPSILREAVSQGLTPLEMYLAVAVDEEIPGALREHHERLVAIGDAPSEPRPLLLPRAWPMVLNEDCDDGEDFWFLTATYANVELELYSGSGFGEDLGCGYHYGSFTDWERIFAGACYKSGSDGTMRLDVEMQQSDGTWWSTMSGTDRDLQVDKKYWYYGDFTGLMICNGYHRIKTYGGVCFSPDIHHLAGAWGSNGFCKI